MDIAKWLVPLPISIIAVFISIFSLYHTWFEPFNLKANPGNPLLGKSPIDSDPTVFGTTPMIPMEFSNSGARQGIIEQLLIRVTTKEQSWHLKPQYFCTEFGVTGVKEEQREVFHPFSLSGNERVYKIILFNPIGPFPRFKTASDIPAQDTWTLDYYVLDSTSSSFKLANSQKFEITGKDLISGQYIPVEESISNAMDRLIKRD